MVNITAIERISRFTSKTDIRIMKKWSERFRMNDKCEKNWYLNKIIKQIREILVIVSGNDILEMLQDVLYKKELEDMAYKKYKAVMQNLALYYKKIPLKQRHQFMKCLKNASLNFSKVKRMGFKISKPLWLNCNNNKNRNLGGGVAIAKNLQYLLDSFIEENSNIASNRLVVNKIDKSRIPARYLTDTKSELYKIFPLRHEISFSCFKKYLNLKGNIKLPHRWTDICDYCEKLIQLKSKIDLVLKDEDYVYDVPLNIESASKYFTEQGLYIKSILSITNDLLLREMLEAKYEKYKLLLSDFIDYEAINFHKNLAKLQKISYQEYVKNVNNSLSNKILIELDFKQKFIIGMSPRQISQEFYQQTMRSCLDANQVKSINFDLISNDLGSSSHAAIRGFRILRDQEFFKKIEKPEYIVWSDCGKHFRNNEFVGYLLRELADHQIHVNLNFFCEKHGKNNRDAHFANLSKFVECESLTRKIESTKDLVDAIMKRQLLANETKKVEIEKVTTYVLGLDTESDKLHQFQHPSVKTLTIKNLESFYNYRTVEKDFKLVTSVISNTNEVMDLKNVTLGTASHLDYEVVEEVCVPEPTVNLMNMHLKKHRINSALIKIKSNLKSSKTVCRISVKHSINVGSNIKITPQQTLPQFCRETPGTRTKPACSDCREICSYSIDVILHPMLSITHVDIIDELKIHHHPSSRKMTSNKMRSAAEAARELANHYIFAHHMKEPVFL